MEKSWLEEELATLRRVRDELRVQMNLAGLEAKDRFQVAEQRWEEFEARARHVGRESKVAAQQVGEALKLLAREVREAYEHVRRAL